MAWKRCVNIAGTVYVPDIPTGEHAPSCPDCYACQRCSAERCAVCVRADHPSIRHDRRLPVIPDAASKAKT